MKKTLFLACLLSGLLLGGFSALGQLSPKQVAASGSETEPVTYIPFEDGNFTSAEWTEEGRTSANNWVTGSYGTFWNHRYFNALDDFYNGEPREGWTGKDSPILRKNSSSETSGMPRLSAFFRFSGPMFVPASTKSVFAEMLETIRPP